MALRFHAPHPWDAIQARAPKQKSYVAVPYLGRNAAKLLPIPAGSVLITRFTKEAVRSGQVDPAEVIKFLRRGVQVHNYGTLHAKVYVFGRTAFIGSANVSKSSQGLAEACLECSDAGVVRESRNFVAGLTGDLVTLEYAKLLLSLYPKGGEKFFGFPTKPGSRKKTVARSRMWLVPVMSVDWDDEAKATDRTGTAKAKASIEDLKKWRLNNVLWSDKVGCEVGDWILYRWPDGRGFLFECPSRVIRIEAVGRGKNHIVYAEQPRRSWLISSAEVRKTLRGQAKAFTFATSNMRLVRAERAVTEIMRLWPQFRLEI